RGEEGGEGGGGEGEEEEGGGDEGPRRRERHLDAEVGENPADPSIGSVQRRQRNAGDRGRKGERQIDRGVKQPAAREVISRQHPGDQQSEHGVDQGRRKREAETRPQRRKDTWFGDERPNSTQPEAGSLRHQRRERKQDDDAEIEKRGAEREPETGKRARLAEPHR